MEITKEAKFASIARTEEIKTEAAHLLKGALQRAGVAIDSTLWSKVTITRGGKLDGKLTLGGDGKGGFARIDHEQTEEAAATRSIAVTFGEGGRREASVIETLTPFNHILGDPTALGDEAAANLTRAIGDFVDQQAEVVLIAPVSETQY